MKLNYIYQHDGFVDWTEAHRISDGAFRLYTNILKICNRFYFEKQLEIANRTLMLKTDIDKSKLDRNRKELIDLGLIEYIKGYKGQCGKYTIVPMYDTDSGNNSDTNSDTNNATNNGNTPKAISNKLKDKSSTNVLPKESPVPYQEIMGLFNSICKSYGEIRSISGKRKEMVSARWKQFGNLKAFEDAFTNAEQSRFMQGENDRNWKADFDWIIKPSNFQKVLEGNYANREKPEDKRKYPDTSYNLAELEERLMSGSVEYD